MRRALVIGATLLLAGLVSGCSTASYFPPSLLTAVEHCDGPDREYDRPVMDPHQSGWYSRHLRAAREPKLGTAAPRHAVADIGVVRFTWLRSFDHPVMIRVEAEADQRLRLTAKELTGAGGYEAGRIGRRFQRLLTAQEAEQLADLLRRTRVLSLPPSENCPPVMENGDILVRGDGAQWVIEAHGPGGYRYVDRWSPEDGPVRELGLHLLGLTGWTIDPIY